MTDSIDYGRLAGEIANRIGSRDNQSDRLDAAKVEEIAKRSAEKAVEAAIPAAIAQTLVSFGLDPLQRTEIQRDFLFIRDMRTLSADSRKHVLFAVLTAITLGIVSAVWLYLKSTGKAG